MSYFERSVPTECGKKLRNIFGVEMMSRSKRIIQLLKDEGVDIQYTIFKGRTHNNESGKGVNELGDQFINNCYIECIKSSIYKQISDDYVR